MTRRQFLVNAAAISALAGPAWGSAQAPLASLRNAASAHGLEFGASTSWGLLVANPEYAKVLGQQCGIIVPESDLKWKALRPTPETYDFSNADLLYSYANSHGMLFRGHTLVWEAALPKWFVPTVNLDNAKHIMLNHISAVVGHYAGRMHSWDVVNEGVRLEDGRADGLKVTRWLIYLGPECIELAFRAAHEVDPKAMLVYNENWLGPETSAAEQKRRAVIALLTRLVKKGVPVHALGIQAHIFAGMNVTGAGLKRFLQAVENLGLLILVMELDVRDNSLAGNITVRDAQVAEQYYDFLSFILQFESVKTVLTWGLSDRYSWMTGYIPRKNGLPVRPLLFDAELRPKPAFDAVRRAFEEAPKP